MDYSFWDHRKEFRLTDIPFLWCEHEPKARIPGEIDGKWNTVLRELKAAIQKGELKAKTHPRDDMTIDRSHLREWAQRKGEKPKFLFEEERKGSELPRKSQRHRERCRALAAHLWECDPQITIADMIHSGAINRHGCEDHIYGEDALRDWIKDLCPDRRPGRRPEK